MSIPRKDGRSIHDGEVQVAPASSARLRELAFLVLTPYRERGTLEDQNAMLHAIAFLQTLSPAAYYWKLVVGWSLLPLN